MSYVDTAEYLCCVERHFEDLKQPIKETVVAIAKINALAIVYLYGSLARFILEKSREGRKNFKPICSDADIMVVLSGQAAKTQDDSKRFQSQLREELEKKQHNDLTVDVAVIDSFPEPLGIKVMWNFDVVAYGENIPMYQGGKFSFPWRE